MFKLILTIFIGLSLSQSAWAEVELEEVISYFQQKLDDIEKDRPEYYQTLGPILIVAVDADPKVSSTIKNQVSEAIRASLDTPVFVCQECERSSWNQAGVLTRNYLDRSEIFEILKAHKEWGRVGLLAYFTLDGSRLSWRFESASTGEVIGGGVVDERGPWSAASVKLSTRNEALERVAAGKTLIYPAWDIAIYPFNQASLGLDVLEQWGPYNNWLTGLSLGVLDQMKDPKKSSLYVGVGLAHYFVVPSIRNAQLGLKLQANLIEIAARSVAKGQKREDEVSPMLLKGVIRIPISQSGAFSGFFSFSSEMNYQVGITILGVSFK